MSTGSIKQPTSFRLSPDALSLLDKVSAALGLSKASALEQAIRLMAKRDGIKLLWLLALLLSGCNQSSAQTPTISATDAREHLRVAVESLASNEERSPGMLARLESAYQEQDALEEAVLLTCLTQAEVDDVDRKRDQLFETHRAEVAGVYYWIDGQRARVAALIKKGTGQ